MSMSIGSTAEAALSNIEQEARDIFGDNIEELLEDFAARRPAPEDDQGLEDDIAHEDIEDEMEAETLRAEQVRSGAHVHPCDRGA